MNITGDPSDTAAFLEAMKESQVISAKDAYNDMLGGLKGQFVTLSIVLASFQLLTFLVLPMLPQKWKDYEIEYDSGTKIYKICPYIVVFKSLEGCSFLTAAFMLNIALQI